jgi:hypothetical protein
MFVVVVAVVVAVVRVQRQFQQWKGHHLHWVNTIYQLVYPQQ